VEVSSSAVYVCLTSVASFVKTSLILPSFNTADVSKYSNPLDSANYLAVFISTLLSDLSTSLLLPMMILISLVVVAWSSNYFSQSSIA
jgi:hypothetical protein